MKLTIVTAMVVFVAITIWVVASKKSERVTLWGGIALIGFGLAASLLVPTKLFPNIDKDSATYLSNTFIIVASVGANLVASAALMSRSRYLSEEEKVYFRGEVYIKNGRGK